LVTERFGDRRTFAIEIGPSAGSSTLRVVDIWASGKQLTVNDNLAYVPSLLHAIRRTSAQVRGRSVPPCPFPGMAPEVIFEMLERDKTEFREHYWFLQWDEIVDNVSKYAYLDRESLVLMFAFRGPTHPILEDRGRVFVAAIQVDGLSSVLDAAANLLEKALAH
jgi:hypothetical protein